MTREPPSPSMGEGPEMGVRVRGEAVDPGDASRASPAAVGDPALAPGPSPVEGEGSLNLDWITPHLAVAGSLPPTAWPALAADGVVAVVDLRAEAQDDSEALAAAGIDFLHLPTPDHHAVAAADLDRGVAFVRGRRAVVHCREGVGRSALLALCALVDAGRAPSEALTLAKDRRWQVSPSPAQYEAWAAWLEAQGAAAPHFDAFAAVAYRHLRGGASGDAAPP